MAHRWSLETCVEHECETCRFNKPVVDSSLPFNCQNTEAEYLCVHGVECAWEPKVEEVEE